MGRVRPIERCFKTCFGAASKKLTRYIAEMATTYFNGPIISAKLGWALAAGL